MTAAPSRRDGSAVRPNVGEIRAALTCGRPRCPCGRPGGKVHCPVHDAPPSGHPDLDVDEREGTVLVVCRVCGPERQRQVIDALRGRGLWPRVGGRPRPLVRLFRRSREPREGGGTITPAESATPQHSLPTRKGAHPEPLHTPAQWPATAQRLGAVGCTLAAYAEAKHLPIDFLRGAGLSDVTYLGRPAVRIRYPGSDGTEAAVRFRLALEKGEGGDHRFAWKSGSKVLLYGLPRLEDAARLGYAVLCEGESDCHTLWHHDIPALGLPGAGTWNEARDAPLLADDRIATIYVVIEPDSGGEAVARWLATSAIRHKVRLVSLGAWKDPSALHVADPDRFRERWRAALEASVPWSEREAEEATVRRAAAWSACRALAESPRILDTFVEDLPRAGLVGEVRGAKLLFLVTTSRLLPRPASAAVKGPSSAGKSNLVEKVLDFFPPTAYYALSAMSERALAYSEEPLAHRMFVIYEAAGMSGDMVTYLIRSLLSEGRIRYETVEKTRDGLRSRLIEREGPTGLLVTTTAVSLHAENETRLISIPVTDTPQQTRDVLEAIGRDAEGRDVGPGPDLGRWHALQAWLEGGPHAVVVPFAATLARLVPPVAIRLRRDFGAVLTLVRAHALLLQATRAIDDAGRVVATLDDYAVVRALVADLVADGTQAAVPASVRETVRAVAALLDAGAPDASVAALARQLTVDKATASRRTKVAVAKGFLKNEEDRRGRPARLVLDEPMPEDVAVFPTASAVAEAVDRCAVAVRCTASRNGPEGASLREAPDRCAVEVGSGGTPPPPLPPRVEGPCGPSCAVCGAAADGAELCDACEERAAG